MTQRRLFEEEPGRCPQGADRARRVGSGRAVVFRPHDHPLRLPAGAYGARFAVMGPPLAAGLGARVYPSPYPPSPIPTPGTPTYSPPSTARCSVSGTCTYDRFWHVVGEPRGSRTQPVFRSQTGYIQFYEVSQV